LLVCCPSRGKSGSTISTKSVGNPYPTECGVNYAEAEPLYPDFLTARDIIQFVGKAKQASKEQIVALAEQLGVNQYWKQPTGTYSSGMLKKVALLMAVRRRISR